MDAELGQRLGRLPAPAPLRLGQELQRLLGLGATQVTDLRKEDGSGWVVLADPEGNEFCILRSEAEIEGR